jgi:hypothetical protein
VCFIGHVFSFPMDERPPSVDLSPVQSLSCLFRSSDLCVFASENQGFGILREGRTKGLGRLSFFGPRSCRDLPVCRVGTCG